MKRNQEEVTGTNRGAAGSAQSTPSKLVKLITKFKRRIPEQQNGSNQKNAGKKCQKEGVVEISSSRIAPVNNFFAPKKSSEGNSVVPLWGTGFDTKFNRGNRYLRLEESEQGSFQEKRVAGSIEMMDSPRDLKRKQKELRVTKRT